LKTVGLLEICYVCLESLENYLEDEIEFDHIYSYVDGYPQELSNFAPIHASRDPRKQNCHKEKGRKSPYEYREEVRIKNALKSVTGLKDLCPSAVQSVYSILDGKITFNGDTLPLL
jgi:hypothetical protein